MVELALLLPFLIWLCAGIVDFGRVYQTNIVAISAARVGARAAADLRNTDSQVLTAVQADAGTTTFSSTTISPSGTRASGDTVTVTVTYSFTPITPIIGSMFPGGVLSVSKSASMVVF